MQLQSIPITDLKPAPYNPRLTLRPGDKRWEKLTRSLSEFDLVQPIVWNKRTGHIVGGHQRCEILRHEGRKAVDCVVVDLPLSREKALNVALNNSEVGGDWDAGKLTALIGDLQSLPDVDPTLTGFDEHQLRALQFEPVEHNPNEDVLSSNTHSQVIVTLTVPPDCWPTIEEALNDLLSHFPPLQLHVRLPAND